MVRVLHVTDSLTTGVGSAVNSLALHQAKRGAKVSVLAVNRPGVRSALSDDALAAGVELKLVSAPSRLLGLISLAWVLLHEGDRFEVLHAHSTVAGVVVRVIGGTRGWSVFYSPHGFASLADPAEKLSLAKKAAFLVERMLRSIGTIIAVGPSEHQYASKVVGSPRVRTLSNVVELPGGQPSGVGWAAARDQRSARRSKAVVVSVGRIASQKRPEWFRSLATECGPEVEFWWIGGGGPASEFFRHTDVEVFPSLSKPEYVERLERADLYISTARYEGMPLALMEAQWLGVPGLVVRAPGVLDALSEGVSGIAVKDLSEMRATLASVVGDHVWLSRMSVAATHWARETFSIEKFHASCLEIYDA
ncbi:glycosyltransferase family 4 protein [Nocardioides bruguierae]|uniref:glycosyltransferase family 4 protein n=1 Tax=Nocardioides bruguierae TaxID=2945102 RepID=UPI0020223690|nr:glycosyltransferase family 4 protein [Nocardioides bruguierae]MCL8026275.1 glycosyltransferase family 4 protein [Nocardioides bruguierae]